jgi:hypothetical protein
MSWFKKYPQLRAGLRAVAVAVIAYLLTARAKGNEFGDLHAFLYGLYGAVIYGIAAVVTPLEPLVGAKTAVHK